MKEQERRMKIERDRREKYKSDDGKHIPKKNRIKERWE